jgi:hypothetical protein
LGRYQKQVLVKNIEGKPYSVWKRCEQVLVLFFKISYNFCEVIGMSKGRDVAGFVLGIVVTLCGVGVIVLNALGMHNDY